MWGDSEAGDACTSQDSQRRRQEDDAADEWPDSTGPKRLVWRLKEPAAAAASRPPDNAPAAASEKKKGALRQVEELPKHPRELLLSIRKVSAPGNLTGISTIQEWELAKRSGQSDGDSQSRTTETASGGSRSQSQSAASTPEIQQEANSHVEGQPSDTSSFSVSATEALHAEGKIVGLEEASRIDELRAEEAPSSGADDLVSNDLCEADSAKMAAVACTDRRPAVGDWVQRIGGIGQEAKDCRGRDNAWFLAGGEIALVIDVDRDGDVRLRNCSGHDSAFVFSKFFEYVLEAQADQRPPGQFQQTHDEKVEDTSSKTDPASSSKDFVFNTEAVEFVPSLASQRAALNSKAPMFTPNSNLTGNLTAAQQLKFQVEAAVAASPLPSREVKAASSESGESEDTSEATYLNYAFPLPSNDVKKASFLHDFDATVSHQFFSVWCPSQSSGSSRQVRNAGRARLQSDNDPEDQLGNDGCMRGYSSEDSENEGEECAQAKSSSGGSPLFLARAQAALWLQSSSSMALQPAQLCRVMWSEGRLRLLLFFSLLVYLSRRGLLALVRMRRRQ